MTSDKASARIWTLSNDNSQENALNLSTDKIWNKCTKKNLNETAGYKKLW